MGIIVALLMVQAVAGVPAVCPEPVLAPPPAAVHADFDFTGLSQLVTTSYRAAEPRLSQSERRAAEALLTRMDSARLAAQAAETSDDGLTLETKIDEIRGDIEDLAKIIAARQSPPATIKVAMSPRN